MVMRQKRKNQSSSFCTRACITASALFLWQFQVPLTITGFVVEAVDDATPSLRRTSITSSIPNYDHCNTKCVTSITTGQKSWCNGFVGDDCSFPYEICPDSVTQCFGPMAVCVDDNGSNPGYYCDCSVPHSIEQTSVMEDILVQDCLDRDTEVCEKGQMTSLYAFCTNGGRCVDQVEQGETHPGCFCPGRFVGRHCEKRRGTGSEYRIDPTPVKVDEFNEVPIQETEDRGIGTWMIILIVFLSLAVIGFLIYAGVLYKRFLSQHDPPPSGDGNSKADMSIHVPPYGVHDNVSTLEMH